MDVIVLGGVFAALRTDLDASTTLLTSGELGGMATADGPVPVRTLAHAARLMRDVGQLGRYGIRTSEPTLDYATLLSRQRPGAFDVEKRAGRRRKAIHENARPCRFIDGHTVETASGERLSADKIIVCVGGKARRLTFPGAEHVAIQSDAWSLQSVPAAVRRVFRSHRSSRPLARALTCSRTPSACFRKKTRMWPRQWRRRFRDRSIPVIDGRTIGFCKLIADRSSRQILGRSLVGERALDVVQVAAVAMAAGMRVDRLLFTAVGSDLRRRSLAGCSEAHLQANPLREASAAPPDRTAWASSWRDPSEQLSVCSLPGHSDRAAALAGRGLRRHPSC